MLFHNNGDTTDICSVSKNRQPDILRKSLPNELQAQPDDVMAGTLGCAEGYIEGLVWNSERVSVCVCVYCLCCNILNEPSTCWLLYHTRQPCCWLCSAGCFSSPSHPALQRRSPWMSCLVCELSVYFRVREWMEEWRHGVEGSKETDQRRQAEKQQYQRCHKFSSNITAEYWGGPK